MLALAAPAGEVTHVSGVSMVRKSDGTLKALAPKTQVEQGDVLVTAQNAYVRVKFTDGGEITLRPNSQLTIERYGFEPAKPQEDSLLFGLLKGGLRTVTGLIGKRREQSYSVHTLTATIGIRGTDYAAQLCQADCQELRTVEGNIPPDGLHVEVFEGRVGVVNAGVEVIFSQGEHGYVSGANVPPVKVPPGSAIQAPAPKFDAAPVGSGLDESCTVQ
jgi:hypothetical protein